MEDISFVDICRALDRLEFADCELVVGIADGGIVPASLVAAKLGCDLKIVYFNYRNKNNVPQHQEPVLLNSVSIPENIKNILLVDDVCVSGKTLDAAKKLFIGRNVTTMVFKGCADYVLFPQISNCVRWPWKP